MRPLVIAHGAANRPGALERAVRVSDVVEADVHRYRGRLEVRHAKSLGPLPIFWDDGRLLAPWIRHPRLEEVLGAVPPEVDLMLDLKGPDPAMARHVRTATAQWRGQRGLLVCARSWRTADALRGLDAASVLHSVGDERGLHRLLRRYGTGDLEGVSIHRRLLDAPTIEALRDRVTTHLWTWPVDSAEGTDDLVRRGVTGLISNHPERLAHLRRPTGPGPA